MSRSGFVNLGDIARACGLSRATVGNILSGSTRYKFRSSTVSLVQETARRMNYRPNQFASSLRKCENKVVLCIVGDSCRHSDLEHVKSLERSLGRRGYNLVVQILVDLPDETKLSFLSNLINFPAGIAIWSLGLEEAENWRRFRDLFRCAPPTLSMNCCYVGTSIDYIQVLWGRPSIEMAVAYFARRGFRRIGLCCGLNDCRLSYDTHFVDTARGMGLEARCYSGERFSGVHRYFETGLEVAEQILGSGTLPEAVYCTSDELAFAMIERLRHHGLRVPDDLYVLGGGDSEFCRYFEFPLPVLSHDIQELCEMAAEDLVMRIERGDQVVGTGRCVGALQRQIYEFPP